MYIKRNWVKGIWELYYLCSFSANLRLFQTKMFFFKYIVIIENLENTDISSSKNAKMTYQNFGISILFLWKCIFNSCCTYYLQIFFLLNKLWLAYLHIKYEFMIFILSIFNHIDWIFTIKCIYQIILPRFIWND